MNPDQNTIHGKLRRLLKLGESSNQHEASLALSKAAELARKHSIDLACVRAEEERAKVAENQFESRAAFDVVEKAAIQVCMSLFRVRCLVGFSTATYIGIEHNVEAAMWAHSFIVEQCGRDLEAFRRERTAKLRKRLSKGASHQYCMAWALMVIHTHEAQEAERPAELESHKYALAIRNEDEQVADYFNEHYSSLRKTKERKYKEDQEAFMAGVRDGRKVKLSRPIKDSENLALL